MGLEVIDEQMYQQYRDAMMPILISYGGCFGFDFKVSETLKSKYKKPINRVFTIDFPSKSAMESFFTDPAYLEVKHAYFEKSVKSVTVISLHEKAGD